MNIFKKDEKELLEQKIRREKRREFKTLSAQKINIEPYFASNYNQKTNLDLITITFNNPKIVRYQINLIKKNVEGNFCHIICDNSNKKEAAEEIKQICEELDVTYLRVQIELPSGYSDSHGRALNWAYQNVVKKRENNFAFIDHDIFPIKKVQIENYLKDNNLFGYIRHAGKIWFLWPAFSFFRYDFVKKAKLNFRKYKYMKIFHYKGADSGSGNWNSIYKNYDINLIPKISCKDVDIINNCPLVWSKTTAYDSYIQTNVSQYIDNGIWFHSICGAEWRGNTARKNEIIYKILDEYLKV